MKKIILLSFLAFLSIAHANVPRSSVALATGGGGAASVEPGDASFMNPANLTHLRGRNFYSSFQDELVAISLTENDKATVMPGAVSYFKNNDTQMFALSLADFAFRNISAGVSLTYWQVEFDEQDKRKTTFNANVGVTWTLAENFGIGFAAENVLNPPDDFEKMRFLTPTSRFGLNYNMKSWFRWRFDFVTMKNNHWDNWVPQTGFETYFSRWFIVRAGVSAPPGEDKAWSAGLGLDLPRFKVDYAYQWEVEGTNEQLHSVDLGIPF